MKKEEFDVLLKKSNLDRKEFALLSGIQYSSVGKWNDNSRPIPVWVQSWLENYIRAKIADDILDSLEPLLKMRKTNKGEEIPQ